MDAQSKSEMKIEEHGLRLEEDMEGPLEHNRAKFLGGRKVWESAKPFVFGGVAGMIATSIIQPLDFFKVRLQLVGEGALVARPSVLQLAPSIIRSEGLGIMYTGLSAALLRQATYTTARMGIFRSLSDALSHDGKPLPFHEKAFCGLAAGALGSLIGNPADLALLRMQADGSLPFSQRRHYKNAFDALQRIVKEEGILRLWRGAGPTVTRAMAVNVAMLATYDQAKEAIIEHWTHKSSFLTQVGASSVSGFSIAAFSLPFDFVKTRIQKMKPLPNGAMPYSSAFDCARKVLRQEGVSAFYRCSLNLDKSYDIMSALFKVLRQFSSLVECQSIHGLAFDHFLEFISAFTRLSLMNPEKISVVGFATYYMRCAPHAMLILLFMERLQLAAEHLKI